MGKGNKPQKNDKSTMKPKKGKPLGVKINAAPAFDSDEDGM